MLIALELVRRVNLLFGIMIMGHAAIKKREITEISFFEHKKSWNFKKILILLAHGARLVASLGDGS